MKHERLPRRITVAAVAGAIISIGRRAAATTSVASGTAVTTGDVWQMYVLPNVSYLYDGTFRMR